MNQPTPSIEELMSTTQITILPDGRVHVHGITCEILELLEELDPHNEIVHKLVDQGKT